MYSSTTYTQNVDKTQVQKLKKLSLKTETSQLFHRKTQPENRKTQVIGNLCPTRGYKKRTKMKPVYVFVIGKQH